MLFEACSAFTRVTACTLALSPYFVTRFTEGFNRFVTSTIAPVASGWSGCRVGLSPTGKASPFHGARHEASFARRVAWTFICRLRPVNGPSIRGSLIHCLAISQHFRQPARFCNPKLSSRSGIALLHPRSSAADSRETASVTTSMILAFDTIFASKLIV
ncbi:hypothetical protein PQR70_21475 [Paraburkholderia madseniana]|uniref:hypothetical protein n=1 Tax=Paraburkholderia madseniana TaxID=2599607 RepID=UPI0038BC98FC